MINLLFTTAHLKSSQFGFYILFLCTAKQNNGIFYKTKSSIISINKKMNNGNAAELQEFLTLPGISHDTDYVYFNPYAELENARSIEIERDTLLKIYDKYSLAGIKIYCQLAWINKQQSRTGEISPFYYKTVNTFLNIQTAAYMMRKMRQDGIIDYCNVGTAEHLKKLTRIKLRI